MTFNAAFWNFWGSVRLTVVLIALSVMDLAGGYIRLSGNERYFRPLTEMGLWEWMRTYGSNHLDVTIWLLALFVLLTLLAANTAVCTTRRIAALLSSRSQHRWDRLGFALRFSPHIMHLAMLIILSGFLLSYLLANTCFEPILTQGRTVPIPGTPYTVRLHRLNVGFYEGDRLSFLNGRAFSVQATLIFEGNGRRFTRTIGLNRPTLFAGKTIHLKEFGPKYRISMGGKPFIHLKIKTDPGIYLYFAGSLLFTAGLFMYVWQTLRKRSLKAASWSPRSRFPQTGMAGPASPAATNHESLLPGMGKPASRGDFHMKSSCRLR